MEEVFNMKNVLKIKALTMCFIMLFSLFTCRNDNEDNAVSGIKVESVPAKTKFNIGETLKVTGFKIKVTYTDGKTETKNVEVAWVTGFDSATAGVKTLTVTYQGKTCTTTVTVLDKRPDDRITLMFLVDEGISNKGLIGKFEGYTTGLLHAVNNIISSLNEIKPYSRPTVLIYPQWYYNANGYDGKNPSEPLNRLSNDFKTALNRFAAEGIPFYIEMYSSGIYTNQNGELGSLPLLPLHYGGSDQRKGLPVDVEVLDGLKEEYGEMFEGIRFHELIGTHDIGLDGNPHGFIVEEEVIRGIIDKCTANDLHLVWGDHSWNLSDQPVPAKYQFFIDCLDYAVKQMGAENITLNWANNGWPVPQYFTDNFKFKGYEGTNYGMSVQDWFWQELDCSTMSMASGVKWYIDANLDCPPEILAAFSLRAIESGYTLIQYESVQSFFNTNSFFANSDGSPSAYEDTPDYSMKLTAKRMLGYMRNAYSYKPSTTLYDYYDSNINRMNNNRYSNPAKRYTQNSLIAVNENGVKVYDKYNNDVNNWYHQDEYRYRKYVFDVTITSASRINLTFSATDQFMVLKNKNSSPVLEFYNNRNGKYREGITAFVSNANGNIVNVIGLNLLNEYVTSLGGDSDEIVALRKNGNDFILELYQVTSLGSLENQNFTVSSISNNPVLINAYGAVAFTDMEFLTMLPVRTAKAYSIGLSQYDYSNRSIDGGIITLSGSGGSLTIKGKIDGATVNFTVDIGGTFLCAATCDINFDNKDELCIAVKNGTETKIIFIDLSAKTKLSGEINLGGFAPSSLISNRIGTYTKNW